MKFNLCAIHDKIVTFREPGTHARSRDTKGRINALIEDLGLAQVISH